VSAVLTFDEDTHTYRVGGVVVPSVTQVLDGLHSFAAVPQDVLKAAQERGTYVHALCEYHDEGDLDPSSIGPYGGYLDAWIEFRASYKAEWTGIEVRGYSARFGFAGTCDRRGYLGAVPYILDIKTSAQPHRTWGIQTAAYRQLACEDDPLWMMARRATVQLRADGTFKFLTWDSPTDWHAFLALITLRNWTNEA
jgi:hypothetical protein